MAVSSTKDFWIHPNALTITLNYFDDPQLIQTSMLAGSVILAYNKNYIGYDAAHNYREWKLQAFPTQLNDTCAYYVHAELSRDGDTAMIIYSPVKRDIEGRSFIDGAWDSTTSSASWFIYLGEISASVDADGATVERVWTDGLYTGTLATDQQRLEDAQGDWALMFQLNSATGLIDFLRTVSSATFNALTVAKNFIFGGHTFTSVASTAESGDEKKRNDATLPTTGYVQKEIEALDDHYLIKDGDDPQDVGGDVSFGGDVSVAGEHSVGGDQSIGGGQSVVGSQTIEGEQAVKGLQTLHEGFMTPNFNDAGGQVTGAQLTRDGLFSVAGLIANSFTIKELIYNVIRAQGGEYVFSPTVNIERCVYHMKDGRSLSPDDYYAEYIASDFANIDYVVLTLRDDELTHKGNPLEVGDIVYGYVNQVGESGQHATGGQCLMHVTAINELEVAAVLYQVGDRGVVANMPPAEGMTIAQRGTEDSSKTDRMTSFYISAESGSVIMLDRVQSPTLSAGNYGASFGKLPTDLLLKVKEYFSYIQETDPVVYARYGIFENLLQFDHLGNPIQRENNRGEWVSGEVYYNTVSYYDTVTYEGELWKCVADVTYDAPSNSNDWLLLVAKGKMPNENLLDNTLRFDDNWQIENLAINSAVVEDGEDGRKVIHCTARSTNRPFAKQFITGESVDGGVNKVVADEWYTLSFELKGTSGGVRNVLSAGIVNESEVVYIDGVEQPYTDNVNVAATANWVLHSYTFKTALTIPADAFVGLTVTRASDFYLDKIKLERGKDVTPWSTSSNDGIGKQGADGVSVEIVSTTVRYASHDSGSERPSDDKWSEILPSVADGLYLWTWTKVVYSTGDTTDSYSVSRMGVDGKGIQSAVVTYVQKENTNTQPKDFPESDWGDFPSSLVDGHWLYTRTVTTYSDGSTSISYSVTQNGQGSYYAGLQEYYAPSVSPTVAPTGYPIEGTYPKDAEMTITGSWDKVRPSLSDATPYLWNFSVSFDSKGNRYVVAPVCIGNFAKGIKSIVETYAISAYSKPNGSGRFPTDISSWTDEAQDAAPTEAKPYQWNKTETTYNDETTEQFFHVSAVKGEKGDKGADSVYADITNEMDSVALTSGGYVADINNRTVTTSVSMFVGTEKITLTSDSVNISNLPTSWPSPTKTLSNGNKDCLLSFDIPTNLVISERNVINIAIVANGITRNLTLTINGVKAGADGSHAKLYRLVPSTTEIKVDKDGVCTPSTLSCNAIVMENGITSDMSFNTANGTLIKMYTAVDTVGAVYRKQNISVQGLQANKYYRFELLVDGKTHDVETIPFVMDGEKGEDGRGITSISMEYAVTTTFSQPALNSDAWKTERPSTIAEGSYLWTKTIVDYTDESAQDTVGVTVSRIGANGTSVTVSKTEYAESTSATTAPTSGWKTSVINVAEGNYLWTRTTFSDGKTAYSVAKNGKSLTIQSIKYSSVKSGTQPADSTFTLTSMPSANKGEYVWSLTTYSDGSKDYSRAYTPNDGVGIKSTTISYGKSTSASVMPTSWQSSIPSVDEDEYLWTQTIIDYTDSNIDDTVSYTYSHQGKTGQAGTSVSVKSIQYQEGDSATTAPTGTWSNDVVEVAQGKYLWTKTTFSDGKVAYGSARQGSDGKDGLTPQPNILHNTNFDVLDANGNLVNWKNIVGDVIPDGYLSYNSFKTRNTGTRARIQLPTMKKGDVFTFSCVARIGGTESVYCGGITINNSSITSRNLVGIYTPMWNATDFCFKNTSEWTERKFTFEYTGDSELSGALLSLYVWGGWCEYSTIKLEQGEEATPYVKHVDDNKGDQGPQGPEGQQGAKGDTGPAGKAGPMLYPAGTWTAGVTYKKDGDSVPYVYYDANEDDEIDGLYYILKTDEVTSSNSPAEDTTNWRAMQQVEVMYAKFLMANFAKFGSNNGGVFYDRYLFSQKGENRYGREVSYTKDMFDKYGDLTGNFIPAMLLDFLSGEAVFQKLTELYHRYEAGTGLIKMDKYYNIIVTPKVRAFPYPLEQGFITPLVILPQLNYVNNLMKNGTHVSIFADLGDYYEAADEEDGIWPLSGINRQMSTFALISADDVTKGLGIDTRGKRTGNWIVADGYRSKFLLLSPGNMLKLRLAINENTSLSGDESYFWIVENRSVDVCKGQLFATPLLDHESWTPADPLNFNDFYNEANGYNVERIRSVKTLRQDNWRAGDDVNHPYTPVLLSVGDVGYNIDVTDGSNKGYYAGLTEPNIILSTAKYTQASDGTWEGGWYSNCCYRLLNNIESRRYVSAEDGGWPTVDEKTMTT